MTVTVLPDAPLSLPDGKARNWKSSFWLSVLLGTIAGLTSYIALGFQHTLSPRNINWLFGFTSTNWFYDPATYYMGWQYFRHSPWTFPLGMNPDYGMEFAGSIAFTDSIPILAYIFKPFSRWLGTDFQYIGIWVLICFILQGVFGALLASRFTRGILPRIVIAGFFTTAPIFLERGWTVFPLMGHWLILWALYLYFSDRSRKFEWVWLIVVALAVNTSFYPVPMVLAIWAAHALRRALQRLRVVPWLFLEGIAVIGTTFLMMWVTGFFLFSVKDAETIGFGLLATNLLGPIDPWGWSLFLQSLPKAKHWIGEGYCYLGLGMIWLGLMALFAFLRQLPSWRAMYRVLPLALAVGTLAIFSLSNRICFATHVLELPNIYDRFGGYNLGAIFRASGRMIWPAYYAVWLAIFYLVVTGLKPWRATIVLAAMLALQIVDFMPSHQAMRIYNETYPKWESPLKDPFWAEAAGKYHQITIVPSGNGLPFIPLAYWGANHGLPTNAAYLGRYPSASVVGPVSRMHEKAIKEGHLDPYTLYIVPEPWRYKDALPALGKEHGFGTIDGYNIIAPYWFAADRPPHTTHLKPGGSAGIN